MSQTLLAHNVYFTLKDKSAVSKAALVQECKKYLTNHPGVVFFACGILCEELDRPVNDRDFDVGLHVIFENQAAHDRYQVSEAHKKFVTENQARWQKARVFDSVVERV